MKLKTLLLLSSLSYLPAATIVQWGTPGGDADIVTANANGTRTTTYSTSHINPANGTNGYSTSIAGQTREFYGAIGPSSNVFGIVNVGGGDLIQMVYNTGGDGGSVDSMIAWESPDFLTSDRELASFSMEFDTRGGSTTARYLIETSDGWYQSNQTFANSTNNTFTSDTSTEGNLTWSPYSSFGITAPAVPVDTTEIISVGASFTSTLSTGNWTGARLRYFQVEAIPEPSTSALAGLGALGLLARRRR